MLRLRVYLHDVRVGVGKLVLGRRNPPFASLVFHLLLFFVLGPLAYVTALVLVIKRLVWRHFVVYAVSWVYVLFVLPRVPFADLLPMTTQSLLVYWLLMFPLAPIGGFAMLSWKKVSGLFGKRTVQDEYEDQAQRKLYAEARSQAAAARKAKMRPDAAKNYLTVGVKIDGEDFPTHLGIDEQSDWVSIKYPLFFQHAFVVGTTGAGKTKLLLRLIYEALHNTRLRIYVIDGKGDLGFAKTVATLAYQHGRGPTPVFMMGQTSAAQAMSSVYDGFRGDREAFANRLSMMMAVDKTVGNAMHYSETYKGLMHLICGVGYAKLGIQPPQNFGEVLDRLSFEWLSQTYAKVPRELATIKLAKEGREDLIAAASARLSNLARPLDDAVDASGFSLEESHCAIFSLRTQSVGVDAKKFLDFLIEDVKDWVGKRQPPGVEALLIIDEFGSFSNESINDVLMLARDSKVGVILATQDVSQLGSERAKRQILANCNTYFLMKTNFPEELVNLAGTIYAVEPSFQLENGMPTGMQSARIQHQFKIPPNDVAQVTPGQCYIINSRYAVKVQASIIEDIPIDNNAIATNFVKKEAKSEQTKHEQPKASSGRKKKDGVPDIPD